MTLTQLIMTLTELIVTLWPFVLSGMKFAHYVLCLENSPILLFFQLFSDRT